MEQHSLYDLKQFRGEFHKTRDSVQCGDHEDWREWEGKDTL